MQRLTLLRPSESDSTARRALERIAHAASDADGQPPFNDQALIDITTGARTLLLATRTPDAATAIGAAVVGMGELELVIDPSFRRQGCGTALASMVLEDDGSAVRRAWAHGDHPASRHLARRFGFVPVRTLLQLRMPLTASVDSEADPAAEQARAPDPVRIGSFRPGRDEPEWVALNGRIFAGHPEQGRMSVGDLIAREAEPWFDAGDMLIARNSDGTMAGYNWLKVDGDVGEIYVLGVDADAAGRGLGRSLMAAGLRRLRERGCRTAALYVDDENTRAVGLYRSMGFADHTVDVHYLRP
ncbi:mycothiol synthase [Okibacterium endophyticum]